MSPTRATTARGERTSLADERPDVLICGASFAGLAVARELCALPTAERPDVLVVDRYAIGERATSACAVPTPWLRAMGAERSARSELPYMSFSTPHGTARYRLPWSWTSFDYRELCLALWEQCEGARFATAKVDGRAEAADPDEVAVRTDRGTIQAPLVVDALGWRRVLATPHYQPPEAPLSRGLEVHPHFAPARGGDALDCWVDRKLVRRGYAWRVPADGEERIGMGSYDPHQHVKDQTKVFAEQLDAEPVRWQGNWFPHRLRAATDDGVLFVGDSAGHCLPLSGEGIRTAWAFGIRAGRELADVHRGRQTKAQALARYHAHSAGHAPFYAHLFRLQRLIPALPPRLLTLAFKAVSPQPVIDRAFTWYLEQAHPRVAQRESEPRAERELARA